MTLVPALASSLPAPSVPTVFSQRAASTPSGAETSYTGATGPDSVFKRQSLPFGHTDLQAPAVDLHATQDAQVQDPFSRQSSFGQASGFSGSAGEQGGFSRTAGASSGLVNRVAQRTCSIRQQ
ncbi:hypothetical protein HNY73_006999 [Argiope bruennichi]|uniref:Uncharacterized protein n=1 Tax=Argiope bruennichi TaxID=94029 RepID=A0A8T0FCL2_ARGBR|nr:hypothetical protein HNY73_006999 [Argiope bruennichi]